MPPPRYRTTHILHWYNSVAVEIRQRDTFCICPKTCVDEKGRRKWRDGMCRYLSFWRIKVVSAVERVKIAQRMSIYPITTSTALTCGHHVMCLICSREPAEASVCDHARK